jgi:FAD synthetase
MASADSTKRRKVMAFGTFDLLHLGHIHYLKHAKRHGSQLIVVVARDDTVKRIKGRKPLKDEQTRVELVASLKWVDRAVLGAKDPNHMLRVIKRFKPDVIALGFDSIFNPDELGKMLTCLGLKPTIIRISRYRDARASSTTLRARFKRMLCERTTKTKHKKT